MTNEVNTIGTVAFSPTSMKPVETRSAAHSESGKQVPPPGKAQPEAKAEKPAPNEADLLNAVEKLAAHARNLGRELQFEIDSDSGQTVVKVVDPETEEVVRQIPSEEAVARAGSKDSTAMNIIDDIV